MITFKRYKIDSQSLSQANELWHQPAFPYNLLCILLALEHNVVNYLSWVLPIDFIIAEIALRVIAIRSASQY